MKKFILFQLLLFVVLACTAQVADNAPWCPPGATWIYRKSGMSPTSYYRYNYDSDTLIAGHIARKMKVTVILFIGPPGYPPAVSAGTPEYYYNSNDSLYWWNGGQFQFLYNFAALAGDRWVERNSRYTSCSAPGFPLQDTLRVRTVTPDTLGGRIYTRLDVRSDSQYFHTGPVLRNIGSVMAPYPVMNQGKCFLMQHPDGAYDPYEFDQLVCYYDNLRGFVPVYNMSFSGANCNSLSNYILAAAAAPSFDAFGWRAGPNPVRNELRVTGAGSGAQYRLCSNDGRLLRAGRLGAGTIHTTGLAPGIYLLELQEKEHRAVLKVVKQ
ncbi:MAG: T9SS type A sorting domain-containing protein [Chitinophagaceae bacterium]|nr:MAG: T9SS type A sorting domain-containing protein [Chitinophagaceae bacterium]